LYLFILSTGHFSAEHSVWLGGWNCLIIILCGKYGELPFVRQISHFMLWWVDLMY
jgi:hypothetical protein